MPLEAPKAIKFVGHQVSSEGKKQFGTYTIRCQDRDGHEWTCEKRYSEFDALRKALHYGYRDFDHLRRDEDLAPLRTQPLYVAIEEEIAQIESVLD